MKSIKKCCFCFLIVIVLILSSCNSDNEKEKRLYLVNHSINEKVYSYSYEKIIRLTLIASYEVEEISDLEFTVERSENASFDNVKIHEIILLENYKDFNIYNLLIQILGHTGYIKYKQISFTINNSEKYTFDTDIVLTSNNEKEVHIYSGDGSADVSAPGFIIYGYQAILAPTDDIELTNIYFEGTDKFNLSNYIERIYINEEPFVDSVKIRKKEKFGIDIRFKSNTPKDYAIIDILVARYIDKETNEEKEAYILVPIQLYNPIEVGRQYIDKNLINN